MIRWSVIIRCVQVLLLCDRTKRKMYQKYHNCRDFLVIEASLPLTFVQQELQGSTALKLHLLAALTQPHSLHHQAKHVLVLLQYQRRDHVYE